MTTTLYEGTKRVHAKPMNRGDYNVYRGWEVPADENPSDEGYLVENVDGGKPNDSRHAGYISWSPVDVFECTYKPVLVGGMTFGQALEAIKTGQRIARLDEFMRRNPTFTTLDAPERDRLEIQLDVMRDYSGILGERIANF